MKRLSVLILLLISSISITTPSYAAEDVEIIEETNMPDGGEYVDDIYEYEILDCDDEEVIYDESESELEVCEDVDFEKIEYSNDCLGELISSGECGDSITWEVVWPGPDYGGYVLNINGIGEMYDYAYLNGQPWAAYSLSISDINISNGITKIGKLAFYGTGKIKELIIPDTVRYIGDSAMSCCRKLTSVTIPNEVTYIGEDAFNECKDLTEIKIPDKLDKIERGTFMGSGLQEVTIPKNVKSIGDDAFFNCKGLSKVTIPKNVESIGVGAFAGCESLIEVVLEEGIESIGQSAFSGCSNLNSINLPNGLEKIDDMAFWGCTKLQKVTIPGSIDIINDLFYKCDGLEEVIIQEGVSTIGGGAFFACSNLSSVTIPESVTEIYDSAFNMTKSPKLKIKCFKGSEAEKYAKSKNIPCEYIKATKKYVIKYVLNGGNNNSANPASYDGKATITLKKPTKKGYTFKGWYSNKKFASSSKVTQIKKGSKKNVTLYAKWEANKYNVAFNGNKATSGKMSELKDRVYDKSFKLPDNKFERKNYIFNGWNTKADGTGKSYKNKESIKNLCTGTSSDKKITLYAMWKKTSTSNQGSTNVKENLETLAKKLDGKPFTVDQTYTTCNKKHTKESNACSNCDNVKIVKTTWFKKMFGIDVDDANKCFARTGSAKSCLGFANFAEWYACTGGDVRKKIKDEEVFRGELTYDDSKKYAQPGDFVFLSKKYGGKGHAAVVVSVDKNGLKVIDSNSNGNKHCVVDVHSYKYKDTCSCKPGQCKHYKYVIVRRPQIK